MEMLREFLTAGSVPMLVRFSCPSTMVACSPAIKGLLFSNQFTFGFHTLKNYNYINAGIYLNVAFTFVGNFTNVEFYVITLLDSDFLILGLQWIKHGTGGPIQGAGKCVAQGDSNTFNISPI